MHSTIELIADATDIMVVVLLTVGMLIALGRAARLVAIAPASERETVWGRAYRNLRIELGKTLLLGLEILIISDILHSIVKRTLEELAIVAMTVVIRIVLSYFLDRELVRLASHEGSKEVPAPAKDGPTQAVTQT